MISKLVVIFTLDLKRVIYEVFNHVIQGDLRQEDAIPLLSDVTVSITFILWLFVRFVTSNSELNLCSSVFRLNV